MEGEEERPVKVFRAALSVATELKLVFPSPRRLELITTDAAETQNQGQRLDIYSSCLNSCSHAQEKQNAIYLHGPYYDFQI